MNYVRFVAVLALVAPAASLAHPHKAADTEAGNYDKIVCKRLAQTGSLVKSARVCKTRRVWQAEQELTRREARQAQDEGLINSARPF